MVRVALYARYSSDNQRAASIEDQFRICREHAKREKWKVASAYKDAGISGSSMILRPGIQTLLQDAQRGEFTIVLAEAVNAFQLLLLTGCRLREIQRLKWEYVFLDEGVIRLPDSKNGARTVQLGESAVGLLKSIPMIAGNPYVITGRKDGGHLTDLEKPWRRIRKEAGLEDVRIHDLRHSFASGALELGEDLIMIGKLLGHRDLKSTARYAHLKKEPIQRAVKGIDLKISAALATNSVTLPTSVD